jgi:hypothetical protein
VFKGRAAISRTRTPWRKNSRWRMPNICPWGDKPLCRLTCVESLISSVGLAVDRSVILKATPAFALWVIKNVRSSLKYEPIPWYSDTKDMTPPLFGCPRWQARKNEQRDVKTSGRMTLQISSTQRKDRTRKQAQISRFKVERTHY